jgi:hypothetical protein
MFGVLFICLFQMYWIYDRFIYTTSSPWFLSVLPKIFLSNNLVKASDLWPIMSYILFNSQSRITLLKPKDWLVCIYLSLFTFWVIMVWFMLLLYLNQWTWCEYYDTMMLSRWYSCDTLGDSGCFLSTSLWGPIWGVTTRDNSATTRVEWDALSWLIRGTRGVVGFAVGSSMG